MKNVIKWGLIALATLIVIGAVFGGGDKATPAAGQTSAAEDAPKVEAIKVTAGEISKAYEENEAAADSQYKDKLLQVSGKVSGITKDITDNTVVALAGSNQFIPVQGTLISEEAAKALTLKKGDKVTLQCKGAGEVASFPMLQDCAVL